MIKSGSVSRFVAFSASIQRLIRFTGCFGLGIALLASVAATPPSSQSPDEQYLQIMATIDRADALRTAGQLDAAHVKYQQAEKALLAFKSANPLFSPKTVAYRLKEVTERADERAMPAQTNAAPTSSAEPAPAKSNVKLLEAGAEPRSVLRYHVKPGDRQTAILTRKVVLDNGGGAPVQVTPAAILSLDTTIKNVDQKGNISYDVVIGEVMVGQDTNATPQAIEDMKEFATGIKGTTLTLTISDRGIIKTLGAKPPTGASTHIQQAAESLKEYFEIDSALPEEAVGVGAKWELRRTLGALKTPAQLIEQYQLNSMDNDGVKVAFTMNQVSSNQVVQVKMEGSGTNLLDLGKVVTLQGAWNTHRVVDSNASKTPTEQKLDSSIEISSK
jgi:hypothetical protein